MVHRTAMLKEASLRGTWTISLPSTIYHRLSYAHILHLRKSTWGWGLKTSGPGFFPLQHLSSLILVFQTKGLKWVGGELHGRAMIPTSIASLSEGRPRCASEMNTNSALPSGQISEKSGILGHLPAPCHCPVVEDTQGCGL